MRKALLLLAVLGAWHLALRLHGRGIPLITDEGEYAVAARAWNEGGLPYFDAFTQKPPMTLLLYRLPWSPRLTATAFSLGTMLVLFACAPASAPLAARLAAPAAYASLSTLPLGDYGFPANTEGFLNLFAALAFLSLLRGRAALAGLFVGLAFMTKQTAAFSGLAVVGLAALLHGRSAALRAALAAAAAPLAFAAYFYAVGLARYHSRVVFDLFVESVFAGNARYAAVLLMTDALAGQVRWFLTTLLPSLLLYWAPALVLLAWGLRGLKAGRSRPVETAAVLWLGASVAGALTGLFLFPHYFLQAAPALCLGAAFGVAKLPAGRRAGAVAVLAAWPALLAPRLYFLSSPRELASRLLHPNPLFETKLLGEEIAERAGPDDRLYVFGSEGALYVYSGLKPATRYTLSYALTLFPESRQELERELQRLKTTHAPRYFVWSCQPLSTLISNQASAGFAYDLRERLLLPHYSYKGRIEVGPDSAFIPKRLATEEPDFTPGDRLLVFERKGPFNRPWYNRPP